MKIRHHLPAALLFAAMALALSAADIKLERGRFVVHGWHAPSVEPAEGWSSLLRVYAGADGTPPVLGRYLVADGVLTFEPRFPLSPGLRVRASFSAGAGKPAVEQTFDIPMTNAAPSTQVTRIFPSSSEIPENQLKFYVEFSAPMQRGTAWHHIRLLNEQDKAVELPFIEFDEELWDREGRRLTVLFDPGRIKRGVLPLEEVGPALEQGKDYKLVIDRKWRDAEGRPLTGDFVKTFRVREADREPIDPERWTISAPAAGTTAALRIGFHEPLDYALSARMLTLEHAGSDVPGTITIQQFESEWVFTPAAAWKPGKYELRVDTALEDLAGNKVGRPFDVDTFERVSRRVKREWISLPFRIGR